MPIIWVISMLDQTRVAEILSELGAGEYTERNGHFKCKCFVCGDSQKSRKIKRLKISYYQQYGTWIAYCFNGGCEIKGTNIYSLYATVKGVSFSEAKKYCNEDVYDAKTIIESMSTSKPKVEQLIDINPDVDLNWVHVVNGGQLVTDRFQKRAQSALNNFICERHIPYDYAKDMVAAFDGKYKGRVIIPIYLDGRLRYFQGRSLFPNIEPKYLNPDVDKDMIISNSDKFDRGKYIMVTEGLIDSWMVGYNQGTSVNGGYFSDDIIQALLPLTDKGVILCPDNPNIDISGRKTLIQFMNESIYAGRVEYFLMDGTKDKDLNDLAIGFPELRIYEYIVRNKSSKFKTEMKLNLNGW